MYLDNAATTDIPKKIYEKLRPYLMYQWYNPSSLYKEAVQVRQDVEKARESIAQSIGAKADEIYFTSGGSESNCWAIQGYLKRRRAPAVVVTTKIEHKSILDCVQDLGREVYVEYVPINSDGFVDIGAYTQLLKQLSILPTVLVSIQFANNEIGTIQNVKRLAEIAHTYGAAFHTDAVQAFGNVNIHVHKMDIDMMSVSGHKIHAPKGIGFLYIRNKIEIAPLIYGSQNFGMRGGTENVAGIIGLAEAVKRKKKASIKVRDRFIRRLEMQFGCTLNGSNLNRLSNNINVTFPQNLTGEGLIYLLGAAGIQISAGSACTSHDNEPSHVLKEIGLSDEEARRTIRISIPDDMTEEDIDPVMQEIVKAVNLLTGKKS